MSKLTQGKDKLKATWLRKVLTTNGSLENVKSFNTDELEKLNNTLAPNNSIKEFINVTEAQTKADELNDKKIKQEAKSKERQPVRSLRFG